MASNNPDSNDETVIRRIGDDETTGSEDTSEGQASLAEQAQSAADYSDQKSLFERDPDDIDPKEIQHLPETVQDAVMNPDSEHRDLLSGENPTETDTTADEPDDEDGTPEPRTLQETGLVDEDGEFEYEADGEFLTDGEVSFGDDDEGDKFYYNGVPFELSFPDDDQKMENASRHLEGLQEMEKGRQKAARMRYLKELAHACYTVRGVPLEDVYLKDKRPVRETPGTDYESDPDAQPLWEAGTKADRRRLGMRANNYVEGATKFRPRES